MRVDVGDLQTFAGHGAPREKKLNASREVVSYSFVNVKISLSMADDLHVKISKQQWFL